MSIRSLSQQAKSTESAHPGGPMQRLGPPGRLICMTITQRSFISSGTVPGGQSITPLTPKTDQETTMSTWGHGTKTVVRLGLSTLKLREKVLDLGG